MSISLMKPDFMPSKLLEPSTNKILSLHRRESFQPRSLQLKNLKVAHGKLQRVQKQVQALMLRSRPTIRHSEERSVSTNPLKKDSHLLTASLHRVNLYLVSASTKRSTAETSCAAAKLSQRRTLLHDRNTIKGTHGLRN